MKKLTDQDIQKIVEERFAKHQPDPSTPLNEEVAAYAQLFTVLATPPAEGLPMDFSAKLGRNLQQQLQKQNRFRFYGVWALVFVVAMTVLYFGLMLIDISYQTNITTKIMEHKWIFILAFLLLFLIQYLDHTSIKEPQLRKNSEPKNN